MYRFLYCQQALTTALNLGPLMFSAVSKYFLELQDDTYISTWRSWYQTVAYTLGYLPNNVSGGGIQALNTPKNPLNPIKGVPKPPLRTPHTYLGERGTPKHGQKFTPSTTCHGFSNFVCLCQISGAGHRFMMPYGSQWQVKGITVSCTLTNLWNIAKVIQR